MAITMVRLQMAVLGFLVVTRIDCCAAVAGTILLMTAVLLIAAGSTRTAGTTISVFGLSASRRGLLALSS